MDALMSDAGDGHEGIVYGEMALPNQRCVPALMESHRGYRHIAQYPRYDRVVLEVRDRLAFHRWAGFSHAAFLIKADARTGSLDLQLAAGHVVLHRQLQVAQIVICEFRQAAGTRCDAGRSEEHTSELQSLMRISYAVFCLKKKKTTLA